MSKSAVISFLVVWTEKFGNANSKVRFLENESKWFVLAIGIAHDSKMMKGLLLLLMTEKCHALLLDVGFGLEFDRF